MKLAKLVAESKPKQNQGGRPPVTWTNDELEMILELIQLVERGDISRNRLFKMIREKRRQGITLEGVPADKSIWSISEKMRELAS